VASGMAGDGLQQRFVALLAVDGENKLNSWAGGGTIPIQLLPGFHEFRVEYKQFTSDLTGAYGTVSDLHASIRNSEASIVFPVRAGLLHRIHYDVDARRFSVSWHPCEWDGVDPEDLYPMRMVERERRGSQRAGSKARKTVRAEVFIDSMHPPAGSVSCTTEADTSQDLWCRELAGEVDSRAERIQDPTLGPGNLRSRAGS
jgi:hypothetical protein